MTLLLDPPKNGKGHTCVSEAWRRAVGQYRRSVNAQRKRDQRDLENGSFWDRIDWSHVRVVLMGAKPGSGSLLSLLP